MGSLIYAVKAQIDRLFNEFEDTIRGVAAREGLTGPQLKVLNHIFDTRPQTCKELAEGLTVTGANITCIVDGLESKGLVARDRQKGDRRKIIIYLTEKGISVISELFPVLYGLLIMSMSKLTTSDLIRITSMLSTVSFKLPKPEAKP